MKLRDCQITHCAVVIRAVKIPKWDVHIQCFIYNLFQLLPLTSGDIDLSRYDMEPEPSEMQLYCV